MPALTQTFPLTGDTTIPAVGFGTYLVAPEDAAIAVRTAIACGYRHIDTAGAYQNEQGVGEGLRAGMEQCGLSRGDMFVTTKLWAGNPAWGDSPKTYAQTIDDCHASLDRLGLDYVDLYLIHSPHGGAERLNEWRALVELQRTGKARHIGVSNFNIDHLEEIKAAGLPMPQADQIELHPWSQKAQLVSYLRENGILPIAYSSLAPLSTWRIEPGQGSNKTAEMQTEDGVFKTMAARYGVSEAQLLLRWGVQSGYPVLPKSLDPQRIAQNIDLGGFSIDDADMALLAAMERGDGIAWPGGDPVLAG